MIIDCISDLHGHYPALEGGDLLIVAGDLTAKDSYQEHCILSHWFDEQSKNYKKIILIAGNHDKLLQDTGIGIDYEAQYLCDSGTEFEGLKIWGSPWTLKFEGMNPHCMAFTVDTEEELAEKWALIPDDVDILVTHSPPFGIYDQIRRYLQDMPISVGSTSLMTWMKEKWKVFNSLKINIFGHIHEHGGKSGSLNMIQFINASHVNEDYEPVNKPVRVIL